MEDKAKDVWMVVADVSKEGDEPLFEVLGSVYGNQDDPFAALNALAESKGLTNDRWIPVHCSPTIGTYKFLLSIVSDTITGPDGKRLDVERIDIQCYLDGALLRDKEIDATNLATSVLSGAVGAFKQAIKQRRSQLIDGPMGPSSSLGFVQ